jgi:hypothetical protein
MEANKSAINPPALLVRTEKPLPLSEKNQTGFTG